MACPNIRWYPQCRETRLCAFTTSSLWAHREATSSLREIMWQPRTKNQVNKGKAWKTPMRSPQGKWLREGQKQRESHPAKKWRACFNIWRPNWMVQTDNQMRPSAIHHADFVCSGKVAVNHHEQRHCQLFIFISHNTCLCIWAWYIWRELSILKGHKQSFNCW